MTNGGAAGRALRPLEALNGGDGVSFVGDNDYNFAVPRTLVQVGLHEAVEVVSNLPMLLSRHGEQWQLSAATGFAGGRNLMVGPRGGWQGNYIPDILQLFPLALYAEEDGVPRLGVQADSPRVRPGGEQLLLDAQGGHTERYQALLQRLQKLIVSRQRLQLAASALEACDILLPLPDKHPLVHGEAACYSASLTPLRQLESAPLQELRDSGGLTLAYALFFSASNLRKMQRMANRGRAQQGDSELVASLGPEDEPVFNFDQ